MQIIIVSKILMIIDLSTYHHFINTHTHTHVQLSCDSDSNVRYGAELLDRLMKDVVSENPHFDVDTFISLLRDRIYSNDGNARQFLVSWVSECKYYIADNKSTDQLYMSLMRVRAYSEVYVAYLSLEILTITVSIYIV